jgi:hypothetical protein
MRAGGTVASTLGATPEQLGRDDVRVAGIMAAATADKLARLIKLVARGKLHVNIEARVPWTAHTKLSNCSPTAPSARSSSPGRNQAVRVGPPACAAAPPPTACLEKHMNVRPVRAVSRAMSRRAQLLRAGAAPM